MLRFPVRRAALLLLGSLLAACGTATRLAYDNGEAAVLLIADQYLNFEGEQRKLTRGAIQRFHAWHRRTELPRYAALLQSAADRVERGLTRDDVHWAIQSLRLRDAALVEAAALASAPLLETLEAENVSTLERRFAVQDRKRIRETLSGDAAQRERARVAAIVARVEEWTGPLSGRQEEAVQRFVRATADHPRQAHESRRRKQRELVALLEQEDGVQNGPDPKRLRAFLLGWEAEQSAANRGRARSSGSAGTRKSAGSSRAGRRSRSELHAHIRWQPTRCESRLERCERAADAADAP